MTVRLPATASFAGCLLLAAATGLPAVVAPQAAYGARLPLALAFALFTPGYLLICTVFPRQDQLDHLARLALSLAAGFPLVIALTLLLHLTPFDRSDPAQLLAMDALALALAAAATLRQRQTAAPLAYTLALGGEAPWRDPYILIALALVIVLASAALNAALGADSTGATSFSLAMGDGAVNPIQADHVILEVQNRERETRSYYIAVTWRGHALGESAPFSLQPGQRRQVSVTTTAPPGDGPVAEDIALFREHAATPYRRLHVWVRTIPFRVPS